MPSVMPNAAARRRSRRKRGRQIATSTSAAIARRRNAAPAGPSSSNSVTANPAPNCSEVDGGDDERDAARLVAHRFPVTTVRL